MNRRYITHDEYGAIFGECECARCHPRAMESEDPEEPELDEAAAWGGLDYPRK